MIEIWKDIAGYEGKYQVSNLGNVKSLNYNNTGKEKVLKPKIKKNNGLLEVTLNKNDKHNYYMLNRLVIETFTETKLNKNDVVMYKDEDKTNCSLDNLFIISRGKRQEITYDTDRRYRPKYEYYEEVLSTKEIANRNGLDPNTVRDRVRRYNWSIYEAGEIPAAVYQRKENKDE